MRVLTIIVFFCLFFGQTGLFSHTGYKPISLKKVAVSALPDDLVPPDLKSVTVDSSGNVFAFAGKSNGQECYIVKFDKNLRFIKRFGRDGKGPSEFTTKFSIVDNRISIDHQGNIYVTDSNPSRFVIFDNDGNYKSEIAFDRDYLDDFGRVYDKKNAANGVFAGLKYSKNSPPTGIIFSLKPAKIKASYQFIEKQTPGNYIDASFGENCFLDCDGGLIVFANSQLYKLRVFDRAGNVKLEIEDKNRKMGKFSKNEMKTIIDEQFTPRNGYSKIRNSILTGLRADKSRFNKLTDHIENNKNVIADVKISGNRIYVFLVPEDIREPKHPVDVYDLSGKLIRKGYFSMKPARIWKDFIFFYHRNEEDDPQILKYRFEL